MNSSCTIRRPTRYGRRAMAITDWPVNNDSSPSTTSGRSSGFSQLGRGFGATAVCSAIAAFLSRDAAGRELCMAVRS